MADVTPNTTSTSNIVPSNTISISNTVTSSKSTLITKVAATTSPSLEFTCYSNGTISDILDVNKTDVVLLDGSRYCHLDESACIWKGEKTLKVLHVQGEKSSKIAGGRNAHFYQLECKKGGSFKASVNASLQIPNPATQTYTTATMTPSPPTKGMSLTIKNKKSKVETTIVHIGDPLLLQITGPGGYTVEPIICSANSVQKPQNDDYILWKNDKCLSNDLAVIENTWKQNIKSNRTITIDMYGFRFVDSENVFVKCKAMFCPQGETCPSNHCVNGTTSSRKKRNAGLEIKSKNGYMEEHISTHFTVVDKRMDTSACSGTFVSVFTYVTALVLTFALM